MLCIGYLTWPSWPMNLFLPSAGFSNAKGDELRKLRYSCRSISPLLRNGAGHPWGGSFRNTSWTRKKWYHSKVAFLTVCMHSLQKDAKGKNFQASFLQCSAATTSNHNQQQASKQAATTTTAATIAIKTTTATSTSTSTSQPEPNPG